MKVFLALAGGGAVVQGFVSITAGLNGALELIVNAGAAAAVAAGCWKWLAGPCVRRLRTAFHWVKVRLEVLEHVRPEMQQLHEELAGVHERLDRGEKRFETIDGVLEVMQSDERRAVADALRRGEKIALTPDGGIERRSDPSGT